MSVTISPQEEEAIKLVSPRKFHRLFTLPATENHGPLKVSYSTAGQEDGDLPTILLRGGMFCTRWHTIDYEYLAQEEGVRVLSIDRFVHSFNYTQKKSMSRVYFSRDLPRPNTTNWRPSRPGFGASTPVPLPQRIPIFLEVIPALLTHLNIRTVSLISRKSSRS